MFRREDGETTGLLTMTNTATCNVAYKVNKVPPTAPHAGAIRSDIILLLVCFCRLKLRRRISIVFDRVPVLSTLVQR